MSWGKQVVRQYLAELEAERLKVIKKRAMCPHKRNSVSRIVGTLEGKLSHYSVNCDDCGLEERVEPGDL